MKSKILLFTIFCLIFSNLPAISQVTQDTDPYGLTKPLFQVKNRDQQTVFAVYPDGVKIFIDDKLKAAGGGFTVGRLGTGKTSPADFFIVRPNDVKVILNETTEKAAGGGFTVGRLGTGKSTGEIDYLSVTPDQTRISVNDSVAGFAIRNNVNGTSENILYLNKQNYFIGHNTGTLITSGIYNSIFGYQAGKNLSTGSNNLMFGYKSGFLNDSGSDNVFIGNKAGENSSSASFSTYIGSESGLNVTGGQNTFVGSGAGTLAVSAANTNNVYIGFRAGGSSGDNKLEHSNICLGYMAGFDKSGSNKLYIANSDTDNPLIYGEFDNQKLVVNGSLSVTGDISVFSQLTVNDLTVDNQLTVSNNLNALNLTVSNNLTVNDKLDVANILTTRLLTVNDTLHTSNLFVTSNLQTNDLLVTGELSTPSDRNLKTNFVKIDSGLKLIQNLNGYYYHWNSEAKGNYGFTDKKQIGLIAQDVELIMPELVSENFDGHKTVEYIKIIPVLINAVNEQQQMIEKLKTDILKMEILIEKLSMK